MSISSYHESIMLQCGLATKTARCCSMSDKCTAGQLVLTCAVPCMAQDHLRQEMQLDDELVFTVRDGEPLRLTAAQVWLAWRGYQYSSYFYFMQNTT